MKYKKTTISTVDPDELESLREKVELLSELAQMHAEDIEELQVTVNLLVKGTTATSRKPTKKSPKKK